MCYWREGRMRARSLARWSPDGRRGARLLGQTGGRAGAHKHLSALCEQCVRAASGTRAAERVTAGGAAAATGRLERRRSRLLTPAGRPASRGDSSRARWGLRDMRS